MKQKKKVPKTNVMNLSLSLLVELGPAVEYTVKAKKAKRRSDKVQTTKRNL